MLIMEENKKQVEFSRLYLDLISKNDHQEIDSVKNPFQYLTLYLSIYPTIIEVNDFNKSFKYQRDLIAASDYAFECFLLELNLLKIDKPVYLNSTINFLFNCYEQSLNNNVFITNTVIQLFSKLCQPPIVNYLNNSSNKILSRWFTLKEPIKSFRLKKIPEDKWFERRFAERFLSKFSIELIDRNTSFTTFKALFEGKYLENKINWTGNKSSLCYFIKLLISENVIHNPKNKHWEIVSEFFLLNGEPIKQSELINQKVTTNQSKTVILDVLVSSLKRYNP
jgi:hypothetical protein